MKKMKKTTITIIAGLMAMITNAATFEWSFAVYNSQSGVAPVNVTAYLYVAGSYGMWLDDGSFNTDTLELTDPMFGIVYSPVGYPVTALSVQATPVSETLSRLTVTWSTDSALDTPSNSAMNQYWYIVFVDDATLNNFNFHGVELYNTFQLSHPYEQWDDFHTFSYYPTRDLGGLQSVPEPSTALFALVGLAAFGLRRRKAVATRNAR